MRTLDEKIKELKNSGGTKRQITDALLELDRDIRDLGLGATKESLRAAKRHSKKIYRAIKEVDKDLGKLFINNIDS